MENVRVSSGRVFSLLGNGVTGSANGDGVYKDSPYTSIQATVKGTGAITATVVIQVTNEVDANGDPTNWCATPLATITLTGTTSKTDGFTSICPFKYIRAVVSNVTGTGAKVTATAGV